MHPARLADGLELPDHAAAAVSVAVRALFVVVAALGLSACPPPSSAGEGEGEGEADACASCGPLQACQKPAGFSEPHCLPNQCTAAPLLGDVCDDEPTGSGCADGAFTIECREGTCVVQAAASGTIGYCISPGQVPEGGHCFGDTDCASPFSCASGVCTNACASCTAGQACEHSAGFTGAGDCAPDTCVPAPGFGDVCDDEPEDSTCSDGAFTIECPVGTCVTGAAGSGLDVIGYCVAAGDVPAGKGCFQSADCVAGLSCLPGGGLAGTCTAGEGEGEGEGGQ